MRGGGHCVASHPARRPRQAEFLGVTNRGFRAHAGWSKLASVNVGHIAARLAATTVAGQRRDLTGLPPLLAD